MPLVRAREVLSDTNWHRIYTVQDGEGATLDVEVSNQTDGAAVVSLAASKELKTITDADIVRRARVPAGADYSPRKNVYPVGYSIYAKTSIAGVVASVFGLDRVDPDLIAARAQFVGRAGTMGTATDAVYEGRIWQDTARTTPAVVNSVVGSIRDDLARFYFEQGTTGNKPFLRGTPTGAELLGGAGSFASAAGWFVPAGWSIAGGKALAATVGVASITRPVSTVSGRVYRVTYTIDSISAGDIRSRLDGAVDVDGAVRTAPGTYVDYLTANETGAIAIAIRASAATTATIDNLQIYDVTAGQVVAPYFLQGDGTKFLVTPGNVDFSASDEVTVVASFRKYSDAAAGCVISNGSGVSGVYALYAPGSPGATNIVSAMRGTVFGSIAATGITAPTTRVAACRSKIATPINTIRVDGAEAGQSAVTLGTGNFASLPIYLFRTLGGAFLPGDIYFWTAINSQRSDADTAVFERLGARASGVTL